MVDNALYDKIPKPDVVLGQHVMPLRAGRVGNRVGTIMGAADSFKVTLFGRAGHGSIPHRSIDPVVIAANVVLRLQNIDSREVNPADIAVVTVGSVQAGQTENIIADRAVLKIKTRTTTPATRDRVLAAIRRMKKAECEASNSPKEPLIEPTSRFPLTINNKDTASRLASSFSEYFGEAFDPKTAPINGSEDVSILATSRRDSVPSYIASQDPLDLLKEVRLELAYNNWNTSEGTLSIRKVIRQYSLVKGALDRCIYRQATKKQDGEKRQRLTPEEEQAIAI
ncbi:hypothetical protein OEA41_006121 [Lepraria neglecta]|uniref:Peptidase M20 dimerisation domain-containing protein n=1 Tax=Lepraria neglecta TaxID=209136 RepID=A0AAE0DKB6_9LECA|nr:hypothetical protein OEA41_006121 [Lepraria neglecta]